MASTGGHLEQLVRLRPRLGELDKDVVWATFDTPQSRARLAGEEVTFLRYIRPRDYSALARGLPPANRLLQERHITGVVSTGAGIALAFLPLARARSIPCHFIESAARGAGPSLSGRILRRIPGVRLYTQHAGWARGPWSYAGSVFDAFKAQKASPRVDGAPVKKIVVTVGTIKPYGFRRLVERLVRVVPAEAEVLWQTGETNVSGLGIRARRSMPPAELDRALREADVVIAHAGIGSALGALEAGRSPLLIPRRAAWNEHVDDHQEQIATELDRRGLATAREADELTEDDIRSAALRRVRTLLVVPALSLREG